MSRRRPSNQYSRPRSAHSITLIPLTASSPSLNREINPLHIDRSSSSSAANISAHSIAVRLMGVKDFPIRFRELASTSTTIPRETCHETKSSIVVTLFAAAMLLIFDRSRILDLLAPRDAETCRSISASLQNLIRPSDAQKELQSTCTTLGTRAVSGKRTSNTGVPRFLTPILLIFPYLINFSNSFQVRTTHATSSFQPAQSSPYVEGVATSSDSDCGAHLDPRIKIRSI